MTTIKSEVYVSIPCFRFRPGASTCLCIKYQLIDPHLLQPSPDHFLVLSLYITLFCSCTSDSEGKKQMSFEFIYIWVYFKRYLKAPFGSSSVQTYWYRYDRSQKIFSKLSRYLSFYSLLHYIQPLWIFLPLSFWISNKRSKRVLCLFIAFRIEANILNVAYEGFHCLGPAYSSSSSLCFPSFPVFLLSSLSLLLLFPLWFTAVLAISEPFSCL